jgi:glycerophosphoryl diester phosphodiesterase
MGLVIRLRGWAVRIEFLCGHDFRESEAVMSRYAGWSGALMLGGIVMTGALYVMSAWSTGEPAPEHNFSRQQRRPLVMAHRGGAGLWPENTRFAYERARELGVDAIEIDVHSTADGVMVVMHDATVDRTTDGHGRINEMTLAEVKKLDAGFRWSSDGEKTFPQRGRGLTIPTLDEVFTQFPSMRFNIEPKQEKPSLAKPLCRMIREKGMVNKIFVGSFRQTVLDAFRKECPEVATSASPEEVSEFLSRYKVGSDKSYRPAMQALQVPEYVGGIQILSKEFVAAAHARNLPVHAWTVNEEADMKRFIDFGVDGLITDYPDRLLRLLGRGSDLQRQNRK